MDSAMSRFWSNVCIKRIGVCKKFVDSGHPVTPQTRIKVKLSLQVRIAYNIQNINQHNIHRLRPNMVDTKKIKINHTCLSLNTRKSITLTDRIPVENWDRVKYRQINKLQNKRGYNKELLKGFMMCSFPFPIMNTG